MPQMRKKRIWGIYLILFHQATHIFKPNRSLGKKAPMEQQTIALYMHGY